MEKNARSAGAPDRKTGWWHPPHSRHAITEWAHPAGECSGAILVVIPKQGKRGQPNMPERPKKEGWGRQKPQQVYLKPWL